MKQLSTCLPIIATLLPCAPQKRTVQQVHGMPVAISATCWHFSSRRAGVCDVAWPGCWAFHIETLRASHKANAIHLKQYQCTLTQCDVTVCQRYEVYYTRVVYLQKCMCVCFASSSRCVCQSMYLLPEWTELLRRLFILIIKPTRCTNFSNLFLEQNSTCFGQFFCP